MIDARLIERLDRERYRSTLWGTIGFALFFGCVIAFEFIPESKILPLLVLLGLIGFVMMIVGVVKLFGNLSTIKRNPDLKKSLNNELIKHYEYKSYKWGFVAVYATLLILYFLESKWGGLTVKFTLLATMYLSIMAYSISQLIYLKR